MEAATVAWHPLGWTPLAFSEIEPFPKALLQYKYPNIPNYGDLTKFDEPGNEWPLPVGNVDLVVGGTPCQAWSVAGKRLGLDDPRGRVALAYARFIEKHRPRWLVWENVPGVYSAGKPGGADFAAFVGALAKLGYHIAYRTLNAEFFGVPQRRRRCILVGYLGDWRPAAAVLFEPESLCRDIEKGRKARKGIASGPQGGAGPGNGRGCNWDGGQVTQALDSSSLTQYQTMPEKNRFPAVLQPCIVQTSELRRTGNISEKDICPTLTAGAKQGDTEPLAVHAVGVPFCADVAPTITSSGPPFSRTGNERTEAEALVVQPRIYENHPTDARVTGPHDTAPTVRARYGTGGGNVPLVNNEEVPQPIAFQPGNLMRRAGSDPSTEVFPTVKCDTGDQSPHVAMPVVPLDGMNLLSRLGECGEDHSTQNFIPGDPSFTLRQGGVQHGVLTPMAVRRLTPEECEALQGFPKGYSKIPWKGKPADQCPDGPRYKACGNSMAVPVMRWVGERIALVDKLISQTQPEQPKP